MSCSASIKLNKVDETWLVLVLEEAGVPGENHRHNINNDKQQVIIIIIIINVIYVQ
jgi:hypothetical protein